MYVVDLGTDGTIIGGLGDNHADQVIRFRPGNIKQFYKEDGTPTWGYDGGGRLEINYIGSSGGGYVNDAAQYQEIRCVLGKKGHIKSNKLVQIQN